MHLPWISRAHHDEVLRVKQDLIDHLKAQVRTLEDRLATPVTANVKVTLPEDFAVIQPAFVRGRRVRPQDPDEPPPPPPINWEEVDEHDLPRLAEIAARELPPGASPYMVKETVNRIRRNIRLARMAKATRTLTTGSVGTTVTQAAAPPASVKEESAIPDHIRQRIEAAEKGE